MKPITCVICGATQAWEHGLCTEWRTSRGLLAVHDACLIALLEKIDRERKSGQQELFSMVEVEQ